MSIITLLSVILFKLFIIITFYLLLLLKLSNPEHFCLFTGTKNHRFSMWSRISLFIYLNERKNIQKDELSSVVSQIFDLRRTIALANGGL